MKKITFKRGLRFGLKFALNLIADVLANSAKLEKNRPTGKEIRCGEKLPFSGKYIIPNEKNCK